MSNSLAHSALKDIKNIYDRDGFVSPIDILTLDEAKYHRSKLEEAEKEIGSLHYKSKVHTALTSPYELAINPKILDLVENIIGPNILLYNVTFIIKEPKTHAHVSWHQDLTYWGLSHDDQVSVWLALSDVSYLSGAMQMIPGSHKVGKMDHKLINDKNNVLLQGQTVENVKEENAVVCSLKPGQVSLHHGWTLHTSKSNDSDDRRIGLNFQYIATHIHQIKHNKDTAICVRGIDEYNNFKSDLPAEEDLDPEALKRFRILDEQYKKTVGS